MLYEIENLSGKKTTVSCSDNGTVVYTVGKRKTTFPLSDCSEYVFSSCDGTSHKLVCGEDGVDRLFLIMLHGEDRLERNNNERETRRHDSLSDMPDKYGETADGTIDVEGEALRSIDIEDLRKAVKRLKPSEQDAVHKLYLDEPALTQAEYARAIGIPESTLRKRVERIREKLRASLR